MKEVHIEVTMCFDLGLCLQGHTKWVGDFSTLVGVYKDDDIFGVVAGEKSFILG
jgi:hypothetical protein